MNEHDLMEALQEQAADVAVGPAPLDSMTQRATTTRRRRGIAAGVVAAAAVVVSTVGVVAVLPGDDTATDPATPSASDGVADVPPDGFRYVGVNRAAIAVPEEWPTNALACGTPTESTVLVDVAGQDGCIVPYPSGSDSVDVREAYEGEDFSTYTPVEVDGVEGLRSPAMNGVQTSGPTVYGGSVYLPDERVVFLAQSSIGADHVDDLLDNIVFLDDQVGVPAINDLDVYRGSGRADELYFSRLDEAGLGVEVVAQTDRRRYEPGTVIDVEPDAGTVVVPGSTVRVTVAD